MTFRGKNISIRDLHYENGVLDITAAYLDDRGVAHGAIRHRIPQPIEGGGDEIEAYILIRKVVSHLEGWVRSKHFEGAGVEQNTKAPEFFGIAEALGPEPDEGEDEPA